MGGKAINVSKEWLYERRAMFASEMAREYGCSANGMIQFIKRHTDIPRWRDLQTGTLCIPLDWLREQAKTRSEFEIGKELGVKSRTIRDYGHKHGIKFCKEKPELTAHTCPCDMWPVCKLWQEYGATLCEVEEVQA